MFIDVNPSFTSAPYTPDRLVAGHFDLVTDTVTITTGQNLLRGALLGKVTGTGEYILSLSNATDGSQVPSAILVADTDATAGAKTAGIYLSGEFNDRSVIFGASHTAASVKATLRDANIYLKATDAA